jgi:hypothetical protein
MTSSLHMMDVFTCRSQALASAASANQRCDTRVALSLRRQRVLGRFSQGLSGRRCRHHRDSASATLSWRLSLHSRHRFEVASCVRFLASPPLLLVIPHRPRLSVYVEAEHELGSLQSAGLLVLGLRFAVARTGLHITSHDPAGRCVRIHLKAGRVLVIRRIHLFVALSAQSLPCCLPCADLWQQLASQVVCRLLCDSFSFRCSCCWSWHHRLRCSEPVDAAHELTLTASLGAAN